MNKRLDNAVDAARKSLNDDLQDELAAVVESFVHDQTVDPEGLLTADQRAELDRRFARPFEPADPERVRSIFGRHGIQTDL